MGLISQVREKEPEGILSENKGLGAAVMLGLVQFSSVQSLSRV